MPKPIIELCQIFERANPLPHITGFITLSIGILNILQGVQIVIGIIAGILGGTLSLLLILSHLGYVKSKHGKNQTKMDG